MHCNTVLWTTPRFWKEPKIMSFFWAWCAQKKLFPCWVFLHRKEGKQLGIWPPHLLRVPTILPKISEMRRSCTQTQGNHVNLTCAFQRLSNQLCNFMKSKNITVVLLTANVLLKNLGGLRDTRAASPGDSSLCLTAFHPPLSPSLPRIVRLICK